MTSRGRRQVLFHFIRNWSRRSVAAATGVDQGRLVLVCEAIHTLSLRAAPTTVNSIAGEIGIDQSGASRLVKSATAAGYLVMSSSATDGRRCEASLTPEGRLMLDQAHRWQDDVFAELTRGWSDKKHRDFQDAMTELIKRSYALDTSVTPTPSPRTPRVTA